MIKSCWRQWGGNEVSVSNSRLPPAWTECSEIMQTRIEYTGAHTSQHISHLETFKKRLKPEFYYVLCDVFIKKKRVERSTVAILKLKLAQSGDGQAWGRPRRSVAQRWREIRRSSDRRRRSWHPISPMTVDKWLSGCENDRRATIVTLHDTGPRWLVRVLLYKSQYTGASSLLKVLIILPLIESGPQALFGFTFLTTFSTSSSVTSGTTQFSDCSSKASQISFFLL